VARGLEQQPFELFVSAASADSVNSDCWIRTIKFHAFDFDQKLPLVEAEEQPRSVDFRDAATRLKEC
jgi:hypothetical protein